MYKVWYNFKNKKDKGEEEKKRRRRSTHTILYQLYFNKAGKKLTATKILPLNSLNHH